MAVAIDAVSPGSTAAVNGGATAVSWSHTVGTGSNQALYVAAIIGFSPADTTHATATVTYNGVAMKSVGKVKSNNQEWGFVEVFRMLAPPTGSHTVVVTSSVTAHSLIGGGISLNNVDQTTPNGPIGTSNFGSGTTATTAAIASATGNLVIAAAAGGSGFSATTGTARFSLNDDTAGGAGNGYCATYAGASTVTPSFTLASDWWSVVAFNVNAVGAVVATPVTELTSLFTAGYVSGLATSGSTGTVGVVNVPDKAIAVVVSGAGASTMTSVVISDSGSHTWTRLVGFNSSSMPLAVDYWYNTTGGALDLLVQVTPTYTSNVGLGVFVHLIIGSSGTPRLVTSLTGATQTPQASGTPSVVGSLIALHYVQQHVTADISSLLTGSTTDSNGHSTGASSTDEFGAGTIYQTAVNSQTSTPVTVGAGAPSNITYAGLVEYVPPSSGSAATGTAAFTLTATGTARAAATGSAALSLTATGAARAPAAGTAALSLIASGAATVIGTAAITFTAAGSARAAVTSSAALTLTATGSATAPATGTASLSFTAAGAGTAPAQGTAAIALIASGAATTSLAGSAAIALVASGSAAAQATGIAALALLATGAASSSASAAGLALLALSATGTAHALQPAAPTVIAAISGIARQPRTPTGPAFVAIATSGPALQGAVSGAAKEPTPTITGGV